MLCGSSGLLLLRVKYEEIFFSLIYYSRALNLEALAKSRETLLVSDSRGGLKRGVFTMAFILDFILFYLLLFFSVLAF
jgi:hypothetical protein